MGDLKSEAGEICYYLTSSDRRMRCAYEEVVVKKIRMPFSGFHAPSICNYHIFFHGGDRYLVIEQLKDTTTSVTNMIEDILADIAGREHIDLSGFKLFEYYPPETLGPQYIYEMAQVRINGEGQPLWSRPSETDFAVIKNQVIPG